MRGGQRWSLLLDTQEKVMNEDMQAGMETELTGKINQDISCSRREL